MTVDLCYASGEIVAASVRMRQSKDVKKTMFHESMGQLGNFWLFCRGKDVGGPCCRQQCRAKLRDCFVPSTLMACVFKGKYLESLLVLQVL